MDDGFKNVVPGRVPSAGEEATQVLGMVVFLCGWAMLFCGLFMAYGVIRSSTHPWPPVDEPRLPRGLGLAATAVLLLSSGSHAWGLRQLQEDAGRAAAVGFSVAVALGLAFVSLQLATFSLLANSGLSLASGAYGSIVFTLIGFHLVQMLITLGGQALVCVKTMRGLYNAARLQPARLWGMYLHAVTAAWCATYAAVYLA
jgi:cytochrome c oxidase subunit 3